MHSACSRAAPSAANPDASHVSMLAVFSIRSASESYVQVGLDPNDVKYATSPQALVLCIWTMIMSRGSSEDGYARCKA